jgi:hypothetical protein
MKVVHKAHGPEWYIRRDIIKYLEIEGWHCEITHGNLYQTGFPDIYAMHPKWGTRWIDAKQPKKYNYTRDQKRKWPVWDSFGVGIWIMVAANLEEYNKLFKPPNWKEYWKASWGKIPTQADIDKMLTELEKELETKQNDSLANQD